MQVQIKKESQVFKPVTIEITFESKEELTLERKEEKPMSLG